MIKIVCPICGSARFRAKFTVNGYVVYRCLVCDVEYAISANRQTKEKVSYDRGYFTGKLAGVRGYENYQGLDRFLKIESNKRISFIKTFTTQKKLLDVGAGTGVFLSFARDAGYRVTGNDIAAYAIQSIRQKGIAVIPGSIEKNKSPKVKFDIITAWDVIEHLSRFSAAFKYLQMLLKPRGFFFLTTPFTDSIDCKILGPRWYGYKKIPEHLIFFNKKSMKFLLESYGFEVITMVSWGFVRDINFLLSKLAHYSVGLSGPFGIIRKFKFVHKAAFFPLTDYMVVARKK